jgi:predicted secreted protein
MPLLAVGCGKTTPVITETHAPTFTTTHGTPTPEVQTQVNVVVGQVFDIPLDANPSTGFDWTVQYDKEMIEYQNYTGYSDSTPPMPGSPSHRTYHFKALKAGQTKITLVYERSKEHGFSVTTVAEIIEVPVSIQ